MPITLYTSGCPLCEVLKTKLTQKGIKYNIEEDTDIIISKGKSNGIMTVPMLEVGDKVLDFSNAITWLAAR